MAVHYEEDLNNGTTELQVGDLVAQTSVQHPSIDHASIEGEYNQGPVPLLASDPYSILATHLVKEIDSSHTRVVLSDD